MTMHKILYLLLLIYSKLNVIVLTSTTNLRQQHVNFTTCIASPRKCAAQCKNRPGQHPGRQERGVFERQNVVVYVLHRNIKVCFQTFYVREPECPVKLLRLHCKHVTLIQTYIQLLHTTCLYIHKLSLCREHIFRVNASRYREKYCKCMHLFGKRKLYV